MGWEEHLRGRQLSQNTSAFLVCMRLEAPQRAAPDLHTLNVIIMGDHQKKEIYFYALTHETNCIKHFDQAGLNLIQICSDTDIYVPYNICSRAELVDNKKNEWGVFLKGLASYC